MFTAQLTPFIFPFWLQCIRCIHTKETMENFVYQLAGKMLLCVCFSFNIRDPLEDKVSDASTYVSGGLKYPTTFLSRLCYSTGRLSFSVSSTWNRGRCVTIVSKSAEERWPKLTPHTFYLNLTITIEPWMKRRVIYLLNSKRFVFCHHFFNIKWSFYDH